jgi:creatinase
MIMMDQANRIRSFSRPDGDKAPLAFSTHEYERRLTALRRIMAARDVPAVLLTSMHNIAYYSGFLYCSFGRAYGCVVTQDRCVTISANIDGA